MAKSQPPRFVCFLCKRKFETAALLTRHKQLSELHRKNLARQDEEIQKQKDEVRQTISSVRRHIQELDLQLSRHASPDPELRNQRLAMEARLRAALEEYGRNQELLENARLTQIAERAGNGAMAPKPVEVHEARCGRLTISAGVASWQGNKEMQEDRYILDIKLQGPEGHTIVGACVLDGHSGSLCVDALLEWLPRNLQKSVSAIPSLQEDHMRQAVHEAIVQTDAEFLAKAREREVLDGSTMILCLVWPDTRSKEAYARGRHRLLVANLGDSRAVLCRAQSGRLNAIRLSDDHKPGRADERKRIEENGGVVDVQGVWRVFTPGPANFAGRSVLWGLAVSRAFGDLLMKEPQAYGCQGALGELVTAVPELHTYDLNLSEDRFLVLACDGVWDVLEDDEAIGICIEHRSADAAANALVRRSFEVGSDDNITAMVVAWQLEDQETAPPSKKPKPAAAD
eukprot:TRINITY_DN80311_c0_g1_i1.p1 TRINITY_DN80311_c0_g1~~TRINITY_DN80311_c0_g1_i1.p1  ORF type:complete len:456 (-),score=120.85 TRINITY_DN80311_c0_g1_i1:125-1492(-)